MPLLGAHMSIAGGYYHAAEAAAALGMETVQLFTKSRPFRSCQRTPR
jgi:deoxyribonuclease-4